ncbi:hypothetical protein SDC9_190191 [bioreactor metagenome]|uniref:Uncharacterized protein n=1 Tax=bioreactor metagenome TaxID=1076179 RepID=A0A645I2E0_9ZZZZ
MVPGPETSTTSPALTLEFSMTPLTRHVAGSDMARDSLSSMLFGTLKATSAGMSRYSAIAPFMKQPMETLSGQSMRRSLWQYVQVPQVLMAVSEMT